MTKKLTGKQLLFIKEYLIDLNATQAAIRAGYSKRSAMQISEVNMRNDDISNAIQIEMDKRAGRIELTMDRVLLEYKRVALLDIRRAYDQDGNLKPVHEWDDDTAAAIAGLESEEIYAGAGADRLNVGRLSKVKLANKVAALADVMKHLGGFEADNKQKSEAAAAAVMATLAAAKTTEEKTTILKTIISK